MGYGFQWQGLGEALMNQVPEQYNTIQRQKLAAQELAHRKAAEEAQLGIQSEDLNLRKQAAEDEDFFKTAGMFQVGQRPTPQILEGARKRGLSLAVHPETGALLQPIWSSQDLADYELKKRQVAADELSSQRWAAQGDLAQKHETNRQINDILTRYISEKDQLPAYIKSLQTGIGGYQNQEEIRRAQEEWRTLGARYRLLLKRAGLSDAEVDQILPSATGSPGTTGKFGDLEKQLMGALEG